MVSQVNEYTHPLTLKDAESIWRTFVRPEMYYLALWRLMTATVDICMYSDSVYYASPLCTVAQCMMLRRASPLSAAACKNYPAATSCPGSCFFPELLNRTQCRRPTDRARYQCCSPPPHCVPHRSMLLTTTQINSATQISTHTSLQCPLCCKARCCAVQRAGNVQRSSAFVVE